MKRFFWILSLGLGLLSISTQCEAQVTKRLFSKAVERVKQNGKETVAQTELSIKHDKTEENSKQANAEVENDKAKTETQTPVSEDVVATDDDLLNTDYAASASSLIAKARNASSEKAGDYYLNAARTQYHKYCQTLDESKVETATRIYNEISSFEATLPAERKPSNELTTPETYLRLIAARKAFLAEKAANAASSSSKTTSTKSKTASSSNKAQTKDPFEGRRADTRTSSGDLHDGKGNKFGSVDSNGNIRHGSSVVCKIDSKGGIYTPSGKLYGQVAKESNNYVLYKYKDTQYTRYEKIAYVESNGSVYKGNSRVGQIQGSVKDSSGKVLTGVLPSGVHVVHEAVVMFLYDIFR